MTHISREEKICGKLEKVFFVFCNFCKKNLKIQNGRHFGRDKIFLKNGMAILQGIYRAKNFVEIAYLAQFSRYKHFCVFLIWKIPND